MVNQPNNRSTHNPWIIRPKPNPEAVHRLFCFPYAGSGAQTFRTWPNDLPSEVELCAIQLPGRESRFRETPFTSLPDLVEVLTEQLYPLLNVPFTFFGHSMGGLVGFELARSLRQKHQLVPQRLMVSARRAPQLPDPLPQLHKLSEPDLIREIRRRYNGIPDAVLQSPDLLHLMLPMLRADLTLIETYRYSASKPLECPITAFGGLQDSMLGRQDLEAWSSHTNERFDLEMFHGDHFFIKGAQASLLQSISRRLAPRWTEQVEVVK